MGEISKLLYRLCGKSYKIMIEGCLKPNDNILVQAEKEIEAHYKGKLLSEEEIEQAIIDSTYKGNIFFTDRHRISKAIRAEQEK